MEGQVEYAERRRRLKRVRDALDKAAARADKLRAAREELVKAVEDAASFELEAGRRPGDGAALDAVGLALRQGNAAVGGMVRTWQASVDASKEAFPTTLPKDSRPDDAGSFLALLSPAIKAELAAHAQATADMQTAHRALHADGAPGTSRPARRSSR